MSTTHTSYCRVHGCQYPSSHVTLAHLCSRCNCYGHGSFECNNVPAKDNLRLNFHNDRMELHAQCSVNGCSNPETHSTRAHVCNSCKCMGSHGVQYCNDEELTYCHDFFDMPNHNENYRSHHTQVPLDQYDDVPLERMGNVLRTHNSLPISSLEPFNHIMSTPYDFDTENDYIDEITHTPIPVRNEPPELNRRRPMLATNNIESPLRRPSRYRPLCVHQPQRQNEKTCPSCRTVSNKFTTVFVHTTCTICYNDVSSVKLFHNCSHANVCEICIEKI